MNTEPTDRSAVATEPSALIRTTRARILAKTGQAKRIREAAGASLRDIGEAVDASAATVYRWETGITRPGAEHARRWEAVLGQLVKELGW